MIRNKREFFKQLIIVLWAAIMLLAVVFSFHFSKKSISPVYDTMVEAATISQRAMEAVKARKIELGIELKTEEEKATDPLNTGMIGPYYTSITTTEGILESKRTSTNPNWAAVIVGMFRRANLKKGDEVAMVFSGSFPALNISAMAAAQAYGLKPCVMASVGASFYGANNEEFTFFDMAEYLYEQNILTHRLDLVSLGGSSDIGKNFDSDEVRDEIVARITASGVKYIYEPDFKKNIDARLKILNEKAPGIKFVLNVGGSSVGLGTGSTAFIKTGYVEPRYRDIAFTAWGKRNKNCGIIQYYLAKNLPVASLLNIKGLALEYGIPYDPKEPQKVGVGNAYYETRYSPVVPIIALVLSAGILTYLFVAYRHTEVNKYERNYILRGRR